MMLATLAKNFQMMIRNSFAVPIRFTHNQGRMKHLKLGGGHGTARALLPEEKRACF